MFVGGGCTIGLEDADVDTAFEDPANIVQNTYIYAINITLSIKGSGLK